MAEIRRYAEGADTGSGFREALRKIWLSGFDDAPEYFDFFYKNKIQMQQAEIFYAVEADIPVGAAYLLNAKIGYRAGPEQKAYYGYAFAILPEYRGKGIYPQLAGAFCRFAGAQGAGIILCPDNEKLLRYYIANGAVRNFITQQTEFGKADFERMIAAGAVRDLLPDEAAHYEQIRNAAFREYDFLIWDRNAVKYALAENRADDGFCKILEMGGKEYLLLGHNEGDDAVRISETTLPAGFLIRSGAKIREKPLVTYGIRPSPYGRAGLILD